MNIKDIKFEKSEGQYDALYKGRRIASLTLTDENDETGVSLVENIYVDKEYRRKGIAAALIKQAKKDHKIAFDNRPRCEHDEDSEGTYLSNEGMGLMMGLLKRGIINKNNILDPERVGDIKVEKKKKEAPKAKAGPSIFDYFNTKKPPESDDDSPNNQSDSKLTT